MDLNDAIEKATIDAEKRRREDPELSKPRLQSIRNAIHAFAVGVMRADRWDPDHPLPPRFEAVVSWISRDVRGHFDVKGEEPFGASINDVVDAAMSAAHDHPIFRSWVEGSDIREFIDADAIAQNMTVYLREEEGRLTA
jgi:hypothetical protein